MSDLFWRVRGERVTVGSQFYCPHCFQTYQDKAEHDLRCVELSEYHALLVRNMAERAVDAAWEKFSG